MTDITKSFDKNPSFDVFPPSFPDQPFFKISDINNIETISEGMPCDVWHVAGNSNYHTNNINKIFIDLIKSKIKKTNLDIFVGDTGYVHWSKEKPLGTYCWDLDELGRFVAVLNDIWLFQRYTNGDVIVWQDINDKYRIWNCLDLDKINELKNIIEKL